MNCSWTSIVEFRASRYFIGLNRTTELKVMTIWISWELPLLNFERLDIFSYPSWGFWDLLTFLVLDIWFFGALRFKAVGLCFGSEKKSPTFVINEVFVKIDHVFFTLKKIDVMLLFWVYLVHRCMRALSLFHCWKNPILSFDRLIVCILLYFRHLI